MNLAIAGCGFVADYYCATLRSYPHLTLAGLYDLQPDRAALLSSRYRAPAYPSLEALLADPGIDLVLNLTNPSAHYEISKTALLAGKHVYSEKPLALHLHQATELVELAESRNLLLASAPCSLLSETTQTLWHLLRHNILGPVRVIYAEMDDGMLHRMPYQKWLSASGLPWPAADEFQTGCTLEHAGYALVPLAALFGPAVSVTSFASLQAPAKLPGLTLTSTSPDLSVACIQFASGPVARLTCSVLAPHDHQLRIIADDGILSTPELWHYRSPVYSRRLLTIRRKTLLSPLRKRHPLPPSPVRTPRTQSNAWMDYARGPAELAAALRDRRPPSLTARFSLHITELALAIHNSSQHNGTYRMTTTFPPLEPPPWTK